MAGETWTREFDDDVNVAGELHHPSKPSCDGIVITHGAGGNRSGALLIALADAFAARGVAAARIDLPFRQRRPNGPPSPSGAARDRLGLERAAAVLREQATGRIWLAGSSYGGRQASMLLAEADDSAAVADALLLLSYPLHPPGKPDNLRVEHFPRLRTPVLFAHGTKDAFGTIDEVEAARPAIAARSELVAFEGAPHGLVRGKAAATETAARIADAFLAFARG